MSPTALNFSLTRRQRWTLFRYLFPLWVVLLNDALMLFFVIASAVHACMFHWHDALSFGAFAAIWIILAKRMLVGQLNLLLLREEKFDITFEEWTDSTAAAGVLCGKERMYFFLDGITAIDRVADLWLIDHFNGRRLVIPASVMSEEHLAHLRGEMQKGQTPEGIKKVIERGKLIQQVQRQGQKGG